jgi:multicomponent Na+:H+ antiporter subunit G
VAVLLLVAVFQLFTVPVGTYLAARAAHRSGQARREDLAVDELADRDGGTRLRDSGGG